MDTHTDTDAQWEQYFDPFPNRENAKAFFRGLIDEKKEKSEAFNEQFEDFYAEFRDFASKQQNFSLNDDAAPINVQYFRDIKAVNNFFSRNLAIEVALDKILDKKNVSGGQEVHLAGQQFVLLLYCLFNNSLLENGEEEINIEKNHWPLIFKAALQQLNPNVTGLFNGNTGNQGNRLNRSTLLHGNTGALWSTNYTVGSGLLDLEQLEENNHSGNNKELVIALDNENFMKVLRNARKNFRFRHPQDSEHVKKKESKDNSGSKGDEEMGDDKVKSSEEEESEDSGSESDDEEESAGEDDESESSDEGDKEEENKEEAQVNWKDVAKHFEHLRNSASKIDEPKAEIEKIVEKLDDLIAKQPNNKEDIIKEIGTFEKHLDFVSKYYRKKIKTAEFDKLLATTSDGNLQTYLEFLIRILDAINFFNENGNVESQSDSESDVNSDDAAFLFASDEVIGAKGAERKYFVVFQKGKIKAMKINEKSNKPLTPALNTRKEIQNQLTNFFKSHHKKHKEWEKDSIWTVPTIEKNPLEQPFFQWNTNTDELYFYSGVVTIAGDDVAVTLPDVSASATPTPPPPSPPPPASASASAPPPAKASVGSGDGDKPPVATDPGAPVGEGLFSWWFGSKKAKLWEPSGKLFLDEGRTTLEIRVSTLNSYYIKLLEYGKVERGFPNSSNISVTVWEALNFLRTVVRKPRMGSTTAVLLRNGRVRFCSPRELGRGISNDVVRKELEEALDTANADGLLWEFWMQCYHRGGQQKRATTNTKVQDFRNFRTLWKWFWCKNCFIEEDPSTS